MQTLNPKQILRAEFLARRDLLKIAIEESDIFLWGKVLFPDKFTLPFCHELHGYFWEIAEDPFTDTLAPRGHGKTVCKCFLIPLYLALNKPNDYWHYMNGQSTSSKATNVNIAIKSEIENNELLRAYYGDQIGTKWTEKQFQLKNGVIFTAVGAGESTRGINYDNKRPDYIILDDLYDDEDIHNPDRIKKKKSWFWGTLYPARAKEKKSCIHIQGTAISKDDLMHELSTSEDVKFRKFTAIKDDNTPLWKELNTLESLMKEKEMMGSLIFSREYQNEVRDDESSIIKLSWIESYDAIPREERIIRKVCGIDPSVGKHDISDATGIVVMYQTRLKTDNSFRYYVVDVFNERISLNERIKLLEDIHLKYKCDSYIVEAIGAFQDFSAELRRRTNLPIKEIVSVKDKITNLELQSSKFENRKVFIKEDLRNADDLVEQLINNNPVHDDMRDALLICLQGCTEKKLSEMLDFVVEGDDRAIVHSPF